MQGNPVKLSDERLGGFWNTPTDTAASAVLKNRGRNLLDTVRSRPSWKWIGQPLTASYSCERHEFGIPRPRTAMVNGPSSSIHEIRKASSSIQDLRLLYPI